MIHIYIKWHIRKQLSLVNISYFEVDIEHCFVTFWELWVFTVGPCYLVCSIETVTWYRCLPFIWTKGDFGCQIVPLIALLLLGFTLSVSAIFYAPTYHQNKKLYDRVRMRKIIDFIISFFQACPLPHGKLMSWLLLCFCNFNSGLKSPFCFDASSYLRLVFTDPLNQMNMWGRDLIVVGQV